MGVSEPGYSGGERVRKKMHVHAYTHIYTHTHLYVPMYVCLYEFLCIMCRFVYMDLRARAKRPHINTRIPQSMTSGIPLLLGLGIRNVRSLCLCGPFGPLLSCRLEGPSTQYFSTLVPKTIQGTVCISNQKVQILGNWPFEQVALPLQN